MRRNTWKRPEVATRGPQRGTRQDPIMAYLDEAYPEGWPGGFLFAMYGAERAGKPLTLDEAKALAARLAAESDDRTDFRNNDTYRRGYDIRTTQVVYYMRFDRLVKIGTTGDIARRQKEIPNDELLATEPGGFDVEHQRHAQFRAYRHRNEWFRYEGELVEHIARLRERAA